MRRVTAHARLLTAMAMTLAFGLGCENRTSSPSAIVLPSPVTPGDPAHAKASSTETPAHSPANRIDATDEVIRSLMGLWNDRIRRESWDFVDEWASTMKWKPIPESVSGMIGAADNKSKSYLVQGEACQMLVSVVPDSDSISVSTMQNGDAERAYRLLAEAMTLERLGSAEELGQKSDIYAAVLGQERIGIVVLTYGTHTQTKGALTGSIMHWREAIARTPQTETVLRQMEVDAKGQ